MEILISVMHFFLNLPFSTISKTSGNFDICNAFFLKFTILYNEQDKWKLDKLLSPDFVSQSSVFAYKNLKLDKFYDML